MLQQTQVQYVLPYYDRFLKRFPGIPDLAGAEMDEVLQLWSGLGYYSRARNLHKASRIVLKKFGGTVPKEYGELLELPGIGPYTAGAVLSIAYNLPVPILDGNVRRVLSRFFLLKAETALWKNSENIVTRAFKAGILPSELNQALMETGALICAPKNPECPACPLRAGCRAREKNLQAEFPAVGRSPTVVELAFVQAVISRENGSGEKEFLVQQRPPESRWLKGMWEFPLAEVKGPKTFSRNKMPGSFLKGLKKIDPDIELDGYLGAYAHTITRHRIKVLVFSGRDNKEAESKEKAGGGVPANLQWATEKALRNLSASSMMSKALAILLKQGGRPPLDRISRI